LSAAGLHAAFAEMHLEGEIAAHGRVAVLITSRPEQLANAQVRAAALELAMQHGFRTLAVEVAGADPIADSRFLFPEGARLHRP
jgi:hypothetical protein